MTHPHSRTGLYDEIDRLQAGLAMMIKRFHEVVADRDEWKQQHENLLEVHRQDLAALAAKIKESARPEAPQKTGVAEAAYAFRESLLPKADQLAHGKFPLWHGWALYEAFEAGAKWARSPPRQKMTSGKTVRPIEEGDPFSTPGTYEP